MVLCCGCCAGAVFCFWGAGFEEEVGACCFCGFEDDELEEFGFLAGLPLGFFELLCEEIFEDCELEKVSELEWPGFETAELSLEEDREDVC